MKNKINNFAKEKVLDFFSSLADETRLMILLSLAGKPRNVNDIYEFVGKDKLTLSAISHQLRQLTDLNIVKFEKKGKEKLFRLSEDFCWCILKDAFRQFGIKIQIKCKKCEYK